MHRQKTERRRLTDKRQNTKIFQKTESDRRQIDIGQAIEDGQTEGGQILHRQNRSNKFDANSLQTLS